jgi:hypothetical protein
MTTTTLDNRNNNTLLLLLALVAIAALALLGTLELTQHAAQGRENTALDATTIAYMIDNGVCKPIKTWECPLYNQRKVTCRIKGDLWGGLILGTAVDPPVIVTGYAASESYWTAAAIRDECYLVR